jgi:hypothetical protein
LYRIATTEVVQRVSYLFRGHPELIEGFHAFLPQDHRPNAIKSPAYLAVDPNNYNPTAGAAPIGGPTTAPSLNQGSSGASVATTGGSSRYYHDGYGGTSGSPNHHPVAATTTTAAPYSKNTLASTLAAKRFGNLGASMGPPSTMNSIPITMNMGNTMGPSSMSNTMGPPAMTMGPGGIHTGGGPHPVSSGAVPLAYSPAAFPGTFLYIEFID